MLQQGLLHYFIFKVNSEWLADCKLQKGALEFSKTSQSRENERHANPACNAVFGNYALQAAIHHTIRFSFTTHPTQPGPTSPARGFHAMKMVL